MSAAAGSPEDAPGVPVSVVVAAIATGVGMIPVYFGFDADRLPATAIYSAGWSGWGLAAALLLDQARASRLGWVFAGWSVLPLVMMGAAYALNRTDVWATTARLWAGIGWLPVALAVASVAWAVDLAPDRISRRRLAWLVCWAAVLFAAVIGAQVYADARGAAVVTMLGLWVFAATTTRLALSADLRPVDEPLADVGVVVGTILVGAAAGVLVRWAGRATGIPSPDVSAAFVAIVAAALSWPLFAWARRGYLERRYGPGVLSPHDVAAITAGLHRQVDPRELLAQAAAMVGAASGHRDVDIILGTDDPEDLAGARQHHALLVGGERVGTLSIRPRHREGPEPRQTRVVDQLLPTVALVARAVGLAVEADLARRDVARERSAERSRILGDLHDGVGPVLAGMSMRVQAELRTRPTPVLEALARELADCRGDLRRIVSDLTPSALHDRGLGEALTRLVDSFGNDGVGLGLDVDLEHEPAPEVAVAIYRSVAEGITNALRHGGATRVSVAVHDAPAGRLVVEVCDDGSGGPVVPGVGLTSMHRRAEQLGGRLLIEAVEPHGVRLQLELPAHGAAA